MQHAGNALPTARQPNPQPQQQSSQGTTQQGFVFSIHVIGVQHCNTIMLQMVHGAGMSAMSLPPIDTTRMSSFRMCSFINLSCLSKLQQARPFKVVASTAVLMATKGRSRSSACWFSQYVTSCFMTGGCKMCLYAPTASARSSNQYLLSSELSPAVKMTLGDGLDRFARWRSDWSTGAKCFVLWPWYSE